jgi:hypothetical protein
LVASASGGNTCACGAKKSPQSTVCRLPRRLATIGALAVVGIAGSASPCPAMAALCSLLHAPDAPRLHTPRPKAHSKLSTWPTSRIDEIRQTRRLSPVPYTGHFHRSGPSLPNTKIDIPRVLARRRMAMRRQVNNHARLSHQCCPSRAEWPIRREERLLCWLRPPQGSCPVQCVRFSQCSPIALACVGHRQSTPTVRRAPPKITNLTLLARAAGQLPPRPAACPAPIAYFGAPCRSTNRARARFRDSVSPGRRACPAASKRS